MSKLNKDDKFLDLSDYGRPFAKLIITFLKRTSCTPIQVTLLFGVCGIAAIICIYQNYYWAALVFLLLKSVLDAADGELARVKNTPSYTGRYLDSIFDFILNLFILLSITHTTDNNYFFFVAAFIAMQLQGTLYNYYYVILRNKLEGGDTTSKIFEYKVPTAFAGEGQTAVTIMYHIFNAMYSFFDKTIHLLDPRAHRAEPTPPWFMTMVSFFGLGFQLLTIGVLLLLGLKAFILPFFIANTILLLLFILVRRNLFRLAL